jgi:hypothetical protein
MIFGVADALAPSVALARAKGAGPQGCAGLALTMVILPTRIRRPAPWTPARAGLPRLGFRQRQDRCACQPTAQPCPDQSNSVPVATSISRRPVVPLDADLSEMRRPFADVVVVGDHRALQLKLERSPDELLRHLEQLLS